MPDFNDLRDAVGEVVTSRRTRSNMTQTDAAAGAGLERSYLSLLEHGKRMPSIEVIYRLAASFGIEPSTFFAEIDTLWKARRAKDPRPPP